jgi:hypothetical protein
LGFGMEKNLDPGWKSAIIFLIAQRHFHRLTYRVLKFILRLRIRDLLTQDPGSGMEKCGSGINIPDPQHCQRRLGGLCEIPLLFVLVQLSVLVTRTGTLLLSTFKLRKWCYSIN